MTEAQADLAANFNERWGSDPLETQDYIVGTNGVISREIYDLAATDKGAASHLSYNNIGAEYRPSSTQPSATATPRFPSSSTVSSINHAPFQHQKDEQFATNKCGVSPLDPDAIKALVVETARRHKVDEDFAVAIAWAESRFDEIRNSPKGARGPMQLIPATAARFGVQDICDPAQNIEGGMKYLRFLLDEFQNPLLVAAAYNSGEGRIYEYSGIPPFPETVGYVAKVVNYQLGLPMPPDKRASNSLAGISRKKNDVPAGVIAVEKTGKFVGGVMHF